MTKKDYIALAEITGHTLATAYLHGGEPARTAAYDALYRPLVGYMQANNEAFKPLTFASAVGTAEASFMTGVQS